MLCEHIVHRAACAVEFHSLIQSKSSCLDGIGKKNNQEADDNIRNGAITGVIIEASVTITAVHGVAPPIMIKRVKDIKRDRSKAPDPDEENDKIHSCITKHHIVVLTVFRRVPHDATLIT